MRQSLRQRLALQVLHHQEVDRMPCVGVPRPCRGGRRDLGADIMDGADVRVVQAGEGLGLALEPLSQVRIGRDMLRKHLDGNRAIEPRVTRLVDLAHPARADLGDDLIGSEAGAGSQRQAL